MTGGVKTENQTMKALSQLVDSAPDESLRTTSRAWLDVDYEVDKDGLPNLKSHIDVAAHLNLMPRIEDLNAEIRKMIHAVSFSDYTFFRVGKVLGHPTLSTLPKELTRVYMQESYDECDFLIEYASANTRPIFFSKVYGMAYDSPYDTNRFRANQKIYELHQKFGYLDHYCIPKQACDGGRNVMLMVSQRGVSSTEFQVNLAVHRAFLHVLCEAIDYVVSMKFSEIMPDNEGNSDIHINPKPLKVLSTLANNDMTMAQVAETLHISAITANQHMATVRRELGVRTTVGAIKKAIRLGLIKYTDNNQLEE